MERSRRMRWVITLVATMTLVAATAVGVSASGTRTDAKTVTIGFVYDSPHNDGGWSQGHDQARAAMEKALKGYVEEGREYSKEAS